MRGPAACMRVPSSAGRTNITREVSSMEHTSWSMKLAVERATDLCAAGKSCIQRGKRLLEPLTRLLQKHPIDIIVHEHGEEQRHPTEKWGGSDARRRGADDARKDDGDGGGVRFEDVVRILDHRRNQQTASSCR